MNRLIALTIYAIYTHPPNIAEVTDRYTLSLSSAVSLLLLLDLIYSFSHNQNCEYALSTLLLIPYMLQIDYTINEYQHMHKKVTKLDLSQLKNSKNVLYAYSN